MKIVYVVLFVAMSVTVAAQDLDGTWNCRHDPAYRPEDFHNSKGRPRLFTMNISNDRVAPLQISTDSSDMFDCRDGSRIEYAGGPYFFYCEHRVGLTQWELTRSGADSLKFQDGSFPYALCNRTSRATPPPQATLTPVPTTLPRAKPTSTPRAVPSATPMSTPRAVATRTPRPRVVQAPRIKDARLRFIAGPGDSDIDQVTLFDADSSSVGWAVGSMGMIESSGRRKLGWTVRNSLNCTMKVSFTLWYGDSDKKNPYPNIDFVGKDFDIGPSSDKRLSFMAEEGPKRDGFTITIQSYAYDCK